VAQVAATRWVEGRTPPHWNHRRRALGSSWQRLHGGRVAAATHLRQLARHEPVTTRTSHSDAYLKTTPSTEHKPTGTARHEQRQRPARQESEPQRCTLRSVPGANDPTGGAGDPCCGCCSDARSPSDMSGHGNGAAGGVGGDRGFRGIPTAEGEGDAREAVGIVASLVLPVAARMCVALQGGYSWRYRSDSTTLTPVGRGWDRL
jgi:hypothetical protein